MKYIVRMLLIAAAGMLFACTTMIRNPEQVSCASGCTEKKNTCMVAAMNADQVANCDAAYRHCMNPCLAMRAYVPAK